MVNRPFLAPAGAVAIAVAVAVGAAACGAGGTGKPVAPVVDRATATRGARDLMSELYTNIRRGSTDGLRGLADPALVTVGPGANDIFIERSAALLALVSAVPPDKKYKLKSTDLRVSASPGGHAAWASDVIVLDGDRYALGVLMFEADDLWTIAAVQIGVPVARKDLATRKDFVPPVAVPAPADPARPLAALFKAAAADPMALQDQLGNRPETVVRDVSGRALVGKKAIKKAWKRQMKGVVTAPRDDGVHARIAPDGTLGWVFGAVDVTTKNEPTVPTRLLQVFERTADGWEVVLSQSAITAR